jgi:rare lipoprotein A
MKKAVWLIFLLASLLQASALSQGKKKTKKSSKKSATSKLRPKRKAAKKVEYGTASFYNNMFVGRKTANGEIFSQKRLTAAHNNVPLGSYLKITSLKSGRSVIVRVTDRLHHRNHRIVDLSRAAAVRLGSVGKGLLKVKVEILGKRRS